MHERGMQQRIGRALAFVVIGAWAAAGEPLEECAPQWYTEQAAKLLAQNPDDSLEEVRCPHGVRLMGDVTWSYNTAGLEFHEMVICVAYSYVPMLLIGVAIFEFLWVRGTRELSFVLFVALTVALNEGLLKRCFRQPRPSMSCCTSCGMPSSHSAFATGFFTLMFLDAAYRVNPMDMASKALTRWSLVRQHTVFCRGPLSNPTTLSNRAFVYVCFQWGVLLLPVPLSRIYLKDHTTQQVIVGSTAGIAYAFAYFYGVYEPFARRMKYAESWRWPRSTKYGYLLSNTLRLPWWRQRLSPGSVSMLPHSNTEELAEKSLVYGRTLTRVEVPIIRVEERDGKQFGVLYGQPLEVFGGKWAGAAWPTHHARRVSAGTPKRTAACEESSSLSDPSDTSSDEGSTEDTSLSQGLRDDRFGVLAPGARV